MSGWFFRAITKIFKVITSPTTQHFIQGAHFMMTLGVEATLWTHRSDQSQEAQAHHFNLLSEM